MTSPLKLAAVAALVACAACAQTGSMPSQVSSWPVRPLFETVFDALGDSAQEQVPPNPVQGPVETGPIPQAEPYYIELGGFTNFVNNNYGQWSGASGRIMFRHLKGDFAKHFTPIFSFATQTRPAGSQATFGLDSYITFNKWFYMIAGVGGSPSGSAILFPQIRYGATGLITIPGEVKGLVGTLGFAQIRLGDGSYGDIYSVGGMYYRGRAIWSGYLSFNENYPGSFASKSGGVAVQYGAEKHYWIGAGMAGGRIAYETISLRPLDVRYPSYGPNFFFQKWITPKWGVILKYDYQDAVNFYQRNGVSASIFFEVGPIAPGVRSGPPPAPSH